MYSSLDNIEIRVAQRKRENEITAKHRAGVISKIVTILRRSILWIRLF